MFRASPARYLTSFLCGVFCAAASVTPTHAQSIWLPDSYVGTTLNLPIHHWENKSVKRKGIILAIHSYLLHGGTYDKTARYFADRGYSVYAPDLRGFGRWKSEGRSFGGDSEVDFAKSKDDLQRIALFLRETNPDTPIIYMGESLGANYGLWLLSETQERRCSTQPFSALRE